VARTTWSGWVLDSGWITGKPEVIGSSVGLVPNALVFTEPIRSRMSAIQETIEKRSGKYVGGSGVRRLFPTRNPTHKKYVLYELPRTLAVPVVLYVVVKPMSG
jgi:hypothetical protein